MKPFSELGVKAQVIAMFPDFDGTLLSFLGFCLCGFSFGGIQKPDPSRKYRSSSCPELTVSAVKSRVALSSQVSECCL